MTPELLVDVEEKRFSRSGLGARCVLREVAFRVREGEFLALVGPSGCGKTTLLNIIAGLDRDVGGRVSIGKRPVSTARIGYVFQQPRLLPWRTVFENVALVLPPPVDRSAICHLLAEVGLGDAVDVLASRLSLGMARRAAIARAFVVEPSLLLLDEPFASLDEALAVRLRQLLLELWRARPTSVLLVTHDLAEAVELADRVLLLSAAPGRLLADIAVPLGREQRSDRVALEHVRGEIKARYHALLSSS